jgi:phage-related protein
MASKVTVEAVFAGDSKSLEKTFDRVGAGAKDLAKDLDKAADKSKAFGGAMDKASGAVDASEGKFMGAADLLDGLGGAFGLPTEGATNLMRSFGDLAGGFTSLGPMVGQLIGKFATMIGITTTQAAATTGAATAQMGLNAAMLANPVGAIILGLAALGAAFFVLWNKVDAFRDALKAAWHWIEDHIPTYKAFGAVIGWVSDLFGSHEEKVVDTTDAYRIMADALRTSLEDQRSRWQTWKVTFQEIADNLIDNIRFYEGWIANLQKLTDRGFGALASKMFELGPTAEKAVGEMVSKSDKELRNVVQLFTNAGDASTKSFMNPFMQTESLKAIGDAGALQATSFKDGWAKGLGTINVPINRVGPAVPHLAEGGIVRSPTLAMIGEAGPEAVVPLSGGGGTGGTTTIQLVLDGRVVTEVVHDGLLAKQRRTPLGLN